MRRQIVYIAIGLCCSLVCVAMSPTNDSIARILTLDEVQVTAKRSTEAIIPVQKLDGAKLQQLSVQSVADALRYFSGVQVKDYGGVGGIKTVDIRSMGTHHLGVFYDGIEIGNAQNGTVDLGKFDMENIDELALYNGQKSELLQAAKDYGSAGTLYIRTRRPRFLNGKRYSLTATMKAGSFHLANPSLLYEQKITDDIHFSANAAYLYSSGKYHFRIHRLNPDHSVAWDTTGIRQNGDIQSVRAEAGLFGYLPQGKWHVKGYFYQSERGIPRAIVRNVWTSSQRQWDRNAFVQASFDNEWELGERQIESGNRTLSLLVSAKYSNDFMRYLNPDTTLMYIDNSFWQQETYLTASLRYEIFSFWQVAASGDWQYNHLDGNMANFVFPRRNTGMAAAATAFNYKWIRLQANVLGTMVSDRLQYPNEQMPKATTQKPRFTPAVFFSYQPYLKEQLFIRAFYKQTFRMPTFNDLYYTDMGNTKLEPEEATQYDAGVEYTRTFRMVDNALRAVDLHVKADGYFNQVKNKIIAVPKGNSQYRWMMMNLGYVEIRGVDLNAGLKFGFSHDVILSVQGTYTYQKAQDFTDSSDPLTYGGQISYIPWHSCSATGSLEWHGYSLNYSFIYVGERYHNSANIRANYEQPWYTHDLALSKIFDFKTWRMSVSAEVNNMLNQQYNVILNYPMPGINGKAIVKFIL